MGCGRRILDRSEPAGEREQLFVFELLIGEYEHGESLHRRVDGVSLGVRDGKAQVESMHPPAERGTERGDAQFPVPGGLAWHGNFFGFHGLASDGTRPG